MTHDAAALTYRCREPLATFKGATFLRIERDRAVYSVPSGSYEFAARDVHEDA
jgi:hypothetical protein